MTQISWALLLSGGLIAGYIDSIAGGAALVTIPLLAIVLGPGVPAVATSKVAGVAAAVMALLVFARKGHMIWPKAIAFGIWVGIGALAGSSVAPYLPATVFKWMVVCLCPILLAVIWNKDRWASLAKEPKSSPATSPFQVDLIDPSFILAGLGCGFYDGFFGPAGGTFMFLALLFVVGIPILPSMAAAKFVNAIAGATALTNYTLKGYVHWAEGSVMALGILVGAFVGAHHATRGAAQVVRPVLAVVVLLLLFHLLSH